MLPAFAGTTLHGRVIPACLAMLFTVPAGKSFFGCGTTTVPGFVGCLNRE